MGGIGIWQIAIVGLIVLILFGRGRISEMMGDFGKGINSFKKGMSEEVDGSEPSKSAAQIEPSKGETPAAEAKDSAKKAD